jgi:glycosyltransferase involved in cell wall biosynthesis
MRLLFISSFYLFPETRYGGAKRLYYFAREWSRYAQLTVISMDACVECPVGAEPRSGFADFLFVPGRKGTGWRERFLDAPEDVRPIVAANLERIRSFLAGRTFDAILLAFPWSLSFLDQALEGIDAPITYLEDDLSFERYRLEAGAARNPFRKAAKRIRQWQVLSFYRPRIARVVRFVGISPQEMDAMARHFPGPKRFMASYGLPLEEYPFLPPPSGGPVLGFIGNYGHPPNEVALRWLAEGLAAAIRLRCPGVRLILAGKGIPAWAHDAFRGQGDVELREDVADLRGFYAGISAFINPIRSGRGMRTKLVEAAAFGRPIISSALGAEGLEDLELRVSETTEGLAEACADWLREPEPYAEARRNRTKVESRYSIGKLSAEFLAFLESK